MRLFTIAAMAVSAAAFGLGTARPVQSAQPAKLSGPYLHDNLAVYFIHGPSAAGPVPLTLAEALAKGGVQVRETGSVQIAISGLVDTGGIFNVIANAGNRPKNP